jgi:uncharacterized integral membrane protein
MVTDVKRINRLLSLILVVICLFLGLWIAQDNAQVETVTLLGFAIDNISLGVWLLVMLFSGVLLGMLASLPLIVGRSARMKRAERQLKSERS